MHRLALRSVVLFLVIQFGCSNANPGQPDASHPGADAPAVDASSGMDSVTDGGSAITPGPAIAYTSGTYTNTFDGLPTSAGSADDVSQVITGRGPFPFSVLAGSATATGMDGWTFANPNGSSTSTEFRAQDGSESGSAGRGVISYGADGSTNRALGVLATSNQVPAFGVAFRNATSGTLTQMTIAYTGEEWRRGTVTTPDSLTFAYGVGSSIDDASLVTDSDLTLQSPNTQASPTDVALDGTGSGNNVMKSKTLTGLAWGPGQVMVLGWSADQGSGHDDGLAIDTFSFSASP